MSLPPDPFVRFNTLKNTRHGLMLFNENDLFIGRALALYGEYAEHEMSFLRRFLRAGDIVVDAGANIGAHTVVFARAVGPSGGVLAFEPQRYAFQTLAANVALNSFTNVLTFQAALGREAGRVEIPVVSPHAPFNFGGVSLVEGTHGDAVREQVARARLDDFTMPSLRLMKVDVEGMELDVLEGAASTIAAHRPFLYVEIDRQERNPPLFRKLAELRYRLFRHSPRLFNESNFAGVTSNVYANIVSHNAVCVPQEHEGPSLWEGLEEIAVG